jgi:hypothetical protein
MGLRRARAKAQHELNDQADRFENVIAEIHTEVRACAMSLGVCG